MFLLCIQHILRYYCMDDTTVKKNAMAPRVFSSFCDNSHADQYDAVCSVWSEHWQADPPKPLQPLQQCWQHSYVYLPNTTSGYDAERVHSTSLFDWTSSNMDSVPLYSSSRLWDLDFQMKCKIYFNLNRGIWTTEQQSITIKMYNFIH